MSRLDNIIARNRGRNRMNERVIVSMAMGVVILVIIGLAVFTDLGAPPEARDARDAPAAAPRRRATRVDGVLLATPPPATPAAPR